MLRISGSKIPSYLAEILRFEQLDRDSLQALNEQRLSKLLMYAFNHVPYYREVLGDCAVTDGTSARLDNFDQVPPLTKDILRERFDSLQSDESRQLGAYVNTSGGSTGEPVRFMQDRDYRDWNIANKMYYKTLGGQEIGDRELRLWGSERDLLAGREKLSLRLKNWLYNRKELNSFRMTPEAMREFVAAWNEHRPRWVEAYVQSIYEFGNFLKRHGLSVSTPAGIVTTAGTLYPEMRQSIESTFGCRVYNRYGSREVGDVACDCEQGRGLHLSVWNHYCEVLTKELGRCEAGALGKVHVTTLNNRAMPLIRYDIGDLAVRSAESRCVCGRNTPRIDRVEGREMTVFRTRDGRIVPGEFFIHFLGVVFNKGFVGKFQVVQETYERIRIRIVILDESRFRAETHAIEQSIRKTMGDDCEIVWEPVREIANSSSGKYMYTISEL